MVEWILLAALTAVVGFPVQKAMDWAWNSWRSPRQPWPLAEVHRRHTRNFWVAAIACAVEAVCATALLASALASGDPASATLGTAAVLAAILFARSARRRWMRWQQAKRAP